MKQKQDELEVLIQEIDYEIQDNPASGIEPGLETGAKKDLDILLVMMNKFRAEVRLFINKCLGDCEPLKETWETRLIEVAERTLRQEEEVLVKISSLMQVTCHASEQAFRDDYESLVSGGKLDYPKYSGEEGSAAVPSREESSG